MSPNSRSAYMAGLMDGEGSFSIGCTYNEFGKPHYAVHIRLYNTNRKLLKWAKEQFGGNFEFRIPEVTNIDLKREVKPMGSWWITGRNAMEIFLLAVLPYLVAKNEQANLLLQYIRMNGKHDPAARQRIANRISFLNNTQDTPETNTQDSPFYGLKIEPELHGDMQSAPVVTQTA